MCSINLRARNKQGTRYEKLVSRSRNGCVLVPYMVLKVVQGGRKWIPTRKRLERKLCDEGKKRNEDGDDGYDKETELEQGLREGENARRAVKRALVTDRKERLCGRGHSSSARVVTGPLGEMRFAENDVRGPGRGEGG